MEKVFFKETQYFRQPWVWLLIGLATVLPVVLLVSELHRSWQNKDNNLLELLFLILFLLAIMLLIIWLMLRLRLVVEVRQDSVWFKFPPILCKWKTISTSEIERFEIRKYKPIMEYGGWGIRSWSKNDRAYNTSGNIGLQLYLKSGKKILLGTQRKQAIEAAMKKMMASGTNT